MDLPKPSLNASIVQRDNALNISWTFANNADEALYVSVRGNIANQLMVEPYTYLSADNPLLVMTYCRIPVPPNMDVFAPDIPFYRLLEAGQITKEECTVALPVHEIHPYCERQYPERVIKVSVSRVAFSTEYFWACDKHFVRPCSSDPTLAKTAGANHVAVQLELDLERPVIVLKRTDGFHRF